MKISTLKEIASTVLLALGVKAFEEKDGKKYLTEDQKKNLKELYGEKFADSFERAVLSDFKECSKAEAESEDIDGLKAELDLSNKTLASLQSKMDVFSNEKAAESTKASEQIKAMQELHAKEKAELEAKIRAQVTMINQLKDEPESDVSSISIDKKAMDVTNEKYLLGVQQAYMCLEGRPYNQRARAVLMGRAGIHIGSPKAQSTDYTSLKNDLGDFYRVRAQDRIQSLVPEVVNLETIFPLESGYQDQAVLVNMFMSEFSQSDNTDSNFDDVVKGTYKFEPEIIKMHDVMFNHKFKHLKELEKSWIGYLNKEGSSTMKMSFIEYILVETIKVLVNEQQIRRIKGVRVEPTKGQPSPFINAADGLLKFIKRQIGLFKIRPFAMGEWTDSTISNYVYQMAGMIPSEWRDTGRVVCYMAPETLTRYHKNNETLYGGNTDYKGEEMYVKEYTNIKIIPVPNMGPSKRIIFTIDGNIRLFEDRPGEMFDINIEQQDWTLKVWSNWKEGVWAYMVGKKYASLAAMPDDYSTQLIWCNDVDEPADYYVKMHADDTTPSVSEHTSIVSVANTKATAITDIDDLAVGKEVRIKCGSATNAVTIAKSGNFSLISAAWMPEVGDIIYLVKRADGKFIEIKRETIADTAIAIAANDATPDVSAGTVFVTNTNAASTAITNLDNATIGVVYTIHGAGSATASTIANSGNFVLTAAMTLSAGKFIKLVAVSGGKFAEISRSE